MDSFGKVVERLEINPDDAEAWYLMAFYLLTKFKSEEEYLEAVKKDSSYQLIDFYTLVVPSLIGEYLKRIANVDLENMDEYDSAILGALIKSSDLGYKDAQDCLSSLGARFFKNGKYESAYTYISKLAEKGHSEAQYNLSIMFDQGIYVQKDPKEAFQWCYKAAIQGHPGAIGNLGMCYLNGEGVERDRNIAREWFKKGAAAGNEISAECLRKFG